MFDFHTDKPRYFNIQYTISKDYIIPFVKPHLDFDQKLDVLEIGCGEAGVLKAFTERGDTCLGVELSVKRVELAKEFLAEELAAGQIKLISDNIYNIDVDKDLDTKFDLVILKDVIEHIHDQEKFMSVLKGFLKPEGKVFFAFPPWYMPFGGHQQLAKSKLSKLPYLHLLPYGFYKRMLKVFGESEQKVENLMEIRDTGITMERFEKILKQLKYKTYNKQLWLFNPIYKYKFNINERKQISLLSAIPGFRNFVTTCAYYLVGVED